MSNSLSFESRVSQPLAGKISDFDGLRVKDFYGDVINLLNMSRGLEDMISGDSANAAAERGDLQRAEQILEVERRLGTLHRCAIESAVIYMNVLMHELYERPRTEINMNVFIQKAEAPALNPGILLSAYRLNVFRNKIITHHETRRMAARSTSATGERRQAPLPPNMGMADEDVVAIMGLKETYKASDPVLDREENQFGILRRLFETVPVFAASGAKNSDRTVVDKIAERGGVESPTIAEILQTLDDFSDELVRLWSSRSNP